jgi:hypothetical protein
MVIIFKSYSQYTAFVKEMNFTKKQLSKINSQCHFFKERTMNIINCHRLILVTTLMCLPMLAVPMLMCYLLEVFALYRCDLLMF